MEHLERHNRPYPLPTWTDGAAAMEAAAAAEDVVWGRERLVVKKVLVALVTNPVGSGKTASMVGLVRNNAMPWGQLNDGYTFDRCAVRGNHLLEHVTPTRHTRLDTTLVVCSQSIVTQWVDEFKRFAPDLTVLVVKTSKAARDTNPVDVDVIIVTTTMFNPFVERFLKSAWKRFIYDEPTSARIPHLREITAGFTWFVSATPNDLYSTYVNTHRDGYMHRLFSSDEQQKYLIPRVQRTNPELRSARAMNLPPIIYHSHACYNPIYSAVHDMVPDRLREMLAAGDIRGAVAELGGTSTTNIYELVKQRKMTEVATLNHTIRQEETTRRLIDQDRNFVSAPWQIQFYAVDGGLSLEIPSDSRLLRAAEQLVRTIAERDRIVHQIDILAERFDAILTSTCNICLETIHKPVMEPNCNGVFCGACLFKWLGLKKTCPACRAKVVPSKIVYMTSESDEQQHGGDVDDGGDGGDAATVATVATRLSKEDMVVDIIRRYSPTGGRFLICSGYNNTFINLGIVLRSNNIPFLEIKGTVNRRDAIVKKYKEGEVPILMMNSYGANAGLNLQETTDVIVFHELRTDIRTQTIGRAQRIGRTASLRVHELCT